jgi:hypothetical protein
MTDENSPGSPLETVAGTAGQRAIEAFSILGNETRLSTLLALWDAYEPWTTENGLSFSELRERLGRPDSGQFNYHLGKLEGQFVRKTDEGYELRRAGRRLVQTIIAGTGLEDRSLDPTEIEEDCYLCGAPTMVVYEDEMLFHVCTECDGLLSYEDRPGGVIRGSEFTPAGFTDRSPTEMLNASWTGGKLQFGLGGVCDLCLGPMDRWLYVCPDHADEGVCPTCEFRVPVRARFRCTVCKHNHEMRPLILVLDHPAVVAFYYDHGVALQYEAGVDFHPLVSMNFRELHHQELVSEDPPLVRVTIEYEGDELRLTLDERLDVVEMRRN